MAKTIVDQAHERFEKATDFLRKAQALSRDDLVARTVLEDAISAVKNALQSYLLFRFSQSPNDSNGQHWQYVANGNSMPDLILVCAQAGLNISHIGREIGKLNDARNARTHDDPRRRIDAEQARRAMELAYIVVQRANEALNGQQAARLPVPATSSGRVPLHNNGGAGYAAATAARQSPAEVATAVRTPPPLPRAALVPSTPGAAPAPSVSSETPATAEPATVSSEDEDTPATDDTAIFPALAPRRAAIGRGRWGRRAVAAALAAGGLAAGLALAIPLARGGLPTGLAFAHAWYATPPRAAAAPVPAAVATLAASTTARSAGSLTVSAPACQASLDILYLRNTGRTPLNWAVGAPMSGEVASFATTTAGNAQPSLLGTLAPGGALTVYVSASSAQPYPLVILAPGGAIPIVAPAC